MKICNVCGKEFEENSLTQKNAEDGTQYYICEKCENEGVEVSETKEYYICKQCGYPHQKDEFNGICKFCEQKNGFEKIDLTSVEEDLLDTDPQKIYKEKLGDEAAKKIAEWIESPQRKEVGIRHKRDRIIDTAFAIALIICYIMAEINIRAYKINKIGTLILFIPAILTLITPPIFKKMDRIKQRPLWIVYFEIAIFTIAYWIIKSVLI